MIVRVIVVLRMMTSAQVVETSVTNIDNSPSQDYNNPDNHNIPSIVFFQQNLWYLRLNKYISVSFV